MDNRDKLIELGKGKLFEAELLHGLFTSGNLYGFETFDDFCKAPIINGGLGRTPKTVHKNIELYEAFVIKLKVDMERLHRIGQTNLFKILPLINEDNAEELLFKAESLTSKHLKWEIEGTVPERCNHQWEPWSKCKVCGIWSKDNIITQ